MNSAACPIKEEEILNSTFKYLVRHGLENITIRELCKGTGFVQGTLYYRFGDKTNLICCATEHGLKEVTNNIFEYVFANMGNLRRFFSNCLSEVSQYEKELRFIYQTAASPIYGEKIRAKGRELDSIYDTYAKKLAARLNCPEEMLRPLVYLFISSVLDYVIWGGGEKTQMQLEFIYSSLAERLQGARST